MSGARHGPIAPGAARLSSPRCCAPGISSTATGLVSPILLPRFTVVVDRVPAVLTSGSFWPDLRGDARRAGRGFPIAAVAGLHRRLSSSAATRYSVRVFDPLFAGLYSIPTILLFPLYVLFFGLGAGIEDRHRRDHRLLPGRAQHHRRLRLCRQDLHDRGALDGRLGACRCSGRVMLPAAFPVVLTGLRMGFILAFLAILGSETIASLAGLGHRIVTYAESMDPAKMFAYIFFAIIIGVRAERRRRVARGAGCSGGTDERMPLLGPGPRACSSSSALSSVGGGRAAVAAIRCS